MRTRPRDRDPSTADRKASAEAAAWLVRLYGEDRSPELEQGLREWLAQHPRNARLFEEMTEVWELGGQTSPQGLPRMGLREPERASLNWQWAMAAVAMLLVVGAAWVLASHAGWITPRYATGHGEQRMVRLQDGSRIILNSSTRLQVDFAETSRRVRLERGEAFFEVAQDPGRPFTVMAGARRITALGTSFVVRHEADRTAVTLVEGKVRVTEAGRDGEPSVQAANRVPVPRAAILTPGERLTFGNEAPPKLDQPRIDTLTAWRRGEVLLDETPLTEAVAEMNRYDGRQLVIDDSELGSLEISGVYRSGDSEGFARAVAELHGFSIAEDSERIHLKR
jgi:transmembrane sensor